MRILTGIAVGWLVFVAAFLGLTGAHWWWRYVELAPPVVFLAVPVLMLLLAWRLRPGLARRGVVVTSLAALALGADLAGIFAGQAVPAKADAPASAVRVLSWNTEYWHHGADPGEFYDWLLSQNADVYLLQEYLGWDFERDLPRRFDDLALLRRNFPGYHLAHAGELLTLSRYPIAAIVPLDGGSPVPGDTEYPEYYRYKVLRTDIDVRGSVFSAYNVHMPVQVALQASPASARFWNFTRTQHERRLDSHRVLRADLAANPLPALVAGDFNATAAMGELRSLGELLHQPRPRRLYSATWKGLWRLDWAFTTPRVLVHDYRMIDTRGFSDHRAQLLVLSP